MIGRVRRVLYYRRCLDLFTASSSQEASLPHGYEQFSFRPLSVNDFSADALFREKNRFSKFVKRLASGHQCFGFVEPGGQIVAYFWLSIAHDASTTVPLAGALSFQIDPGHAYVWDCRTRESFQGRGLYREGLRRAQALAFTLGARSASIVCNADNLASRTGILAAGFTHHTTVEVFRVFGLWIVKDKVRSAYLPSWRPVLPLSDFLCLPA